MSGLIVRLLGAPRWMLIAATALAMLGTHATAWRLGGAHQFRAGFAAGETALRDRFSAAEGRRTTRQLKDRLNAETSPALGDAGDGLRCGPSTRDCPE